MGKIRKIFSRGSIKAIFVWYMLGCTLTALLLSLIFSNACQLVRSRIYDKYKVFYKNTYKEIEVEGGQLLEYYTNNPRSYLTPYEDHLVDVMSYLSIAVYPICFICCITGTSVLFYRRQLYRPLAILDHAAEQIADNNLDFRIVYKKEDEMGKLCASFEKMRAALQENNEEMWRQMEERKRLNTAFAHDLRTPLTVLKGQVELLRRYAPKMSAEKVISTSDMMHRHIARLEAYVQTMSDLQRLEDIEIIRQSIGMRTLYGQLMETGKVVCAKKEFSCECMADTNTALHVDASIVQRVFENLLANAVRFAEKKITVSIDASDGFLYLLVSDDGTGFAEQDLENATKPFFKTVSETDNEHFGMGLNICKILCEKHGGHIRLGNRNGAAVMAAFRQ